MKQEMDVGWNDLSPRPSQMRRELNRLMVVTVFQVNVLF